MIRRIRPLLAARRTRIRDPLPTPHPGHDRPSCVIVRDRVTGRYWRDPYLIRPTAGDPRSDWSRRRHAHVFTSSDVAAYLVATSGIADRVDLVIVDPPPKTGTVFHVFGFITCTVQLLLSTSIGRPPNTRSPAHPLALARCLRSARTT